MIKIRLQSRRNTKIIHRYTEHDDVRFAQLIDQAVGVGDDFPLLLGPLVRGRNKRMEPLSIQVGHWVSGQIPNPDGAIGVARLPLLDRKSTRLNSSHVAISY